MKMRDSPPRASGQLSGPQPGAELYSAPSASSSSSSRSPTAAAPRVDRLLQLVSRVRKIDNDSTDARRERRSAIRQRHKEKSRETLGKPDKDDVKACVLCRRAKTKCFNVDGAPCTRCIAAGRDCVYAESKTRGRKADRTIQDVLDQMEDELSGIMRDYNVGVDGNLNASLGELSRTGPNGTKPLQQRERPEDSAAHSALHNPLGVLASAAAQSSGLLVPGGQSELYWNNIYSVKPEEDLSLDPVLRGILGEDDLNRLIDYYYAKLSPLFLHLDPKVHTPMFLRMNSPFLTTTIAAIAATYDPMSIMLAPALHAHAHRLASLAFSEGSKSLEVVQAFLGLVTWAQWPSHDTLADRSWAYQGQAMRLACEIRLDLPTDNNLAVTYRHSRPLTDDEIQRLIACRRKTYLLVCLSEIAMATQSGRADTTSGHRLIHPPDLSFLRQDDEHRLYFTASVSLNHIVGRALHHWHGLPKECAPDGERELFVRLWRADLHEWKKRWAGENRLVDISSVYNHIMLLLLSLRVPGSHSSTQTLMREISELGVQLLVAVLRWRDEEAFDQPGGLAYATNFLIVQIAYGAALVHKLSRPLDASRAAEVSTRVASIATLLDQISAARPHAASFACYYASQIRSLCGLSTPPAQSAPYVGHGQPVSDPFDFSFLLEVPDALDPTVVGDQMLSLLGPGFESWS